jgi:imidazolonepropionase-like amidohydrolase
MLLIKNARLLTMAGREYENGYIAMDAGKITSMGDDLKEAEKLEEAGAEIIDAKGSYVLPVYRCTLPCRYVRGWSRL